MKINQKQYNLLIKLLKNYNLKKDISILTPFEASIIIEGILNNGKVKNTYKDTKLSEIDLKKRQNFFDNLVSIKNPYISEKQLMYIKNLCKTSKYELKSEIIKREHANILISFLRDNIKSDIALMYLEEINEDMLIKIKPIESEKNSIIPDNWVLYNVNINGIVDFK